MEHGSFIEVNTNKDLYYIESSDAIKKAENRL